MIGKLLLLACVGLAAFCVGEFSGFERGWAAAWMARKKTEDKEDRKDGDST